MITGRKDVTPRESVLLSFPALVVHLIPQSLHSAKRAQQHHSIGGHRKYTSLIPLPTSPLLLPCVTLALLLLPLERISSNIPVLGSVPLTIGHRQL